MATSLRGFFDGVESKVVSATDKNKSAYVVNKAQRKIIEDSGRRPARGKFFKINLVADEKQTVNASYYYSERSEEAGRRVEPRMGGDFISSWLKPGDKLSIGRVGKTLFAFKGVGEPADESELMEEVTRKLPTSVVIAKAEGQPKRPQRKSVSRTEFPRNPWVREAALRRAKEKCEMPDCGAVLFLNIREEFYLEVHHVIPLAESGEDTIQIVAALCPSCHREQHYGAKKVEKRQALKVRIQKLPVPK